MGAREAVDDTQPNAKNEKKAKEAMKKDKKAEKRTASKPTADDRVLIQNKKLASFVATIRSSDDLMAQIADTNEQLDAGKITAEHARAKASCCSFLWLCCYGSSVALVVTLPPQPTKCPRKGRSLPRAPAGSFSLVAPACCSSRLACHFGR